MALPLICRMRHASRTLKILCLVLLVSTGVVVLQLYGGPGTVKENQIKMELTTQPEDAISAKQQFIPTEDLTQQQSGSVLSAQLQESKARITARLNHTYTLCQGKGITPRTSKRVTHNNFRSCPLVSDRRNTVFCTMAKVGSTFWTRFFKLLRDSTSDTFGSPYEVPLSNTDSMRCEKKNERVSADARKPLRVIFVREPFSRLFSAFVDKLVSPNPIYWRGWGKRAMEKAGVTKQGLQCGQGVTFKQFVRFVTSDLHRTDVHVIPMASQCDHCRESFDIIGKMETVQEDLRYLMSLLNVTFRDDVDLSHDAKLDAIYDSIQGPFKWINNIKRCIPTAEMGRRIWRKLQLRGIISSAIDYPLGNKSLITVIAKDFYVLAVEAYSRSTDKDLLSQQKKQAILEAFRTVPMEDIGGYVERYKDDFEAFGYEKTPSWLFKDRDDQFTDTKSMDWNKPWNIP